MITKYRLFESNENKNLSDEEFLKLYKENCTQHSWSNLNTIYRSFDGKKENYYLDPNKKFFGKTYTQDGKKFRQGAYAELPFYNLFINHDPLWKEYPKRQLICSTNIPREFSTYNYIIIPYDNAKIGVVPSEDIHDDFVSVPGINSLFDFFHNIFFMFENLRDILDIPSEKQLLKYNYNDLCSLLNDLYNQVVSSTTHLKLLDEDEWMGLKPKYLPDLLNVDYIRKNIMNPDKLNFDVLDYNDFKNHKLENNEVWTDSKVLIIYSENKNLERIKELTT